MPFRGLNVQLALNDVDSASTALRNLGLDQRDLALISGLATGVQVQPDELHTLAGLVVDQKKELAALARSSTTVGSILTSLTDIGQPLDFNLEIDNQINAAAIKYKYLDYSNNTMKTADISTSRVSSWSTIGTSILYGGEVKVTGDSITLDSLGTSTAPIAKAFRAEVPTHKIGLKVNGSVEEFYAMKGIPLKFDAFFRNANFRHAVTSISDSAGIVPPVWRVTNKAGGQSYNTGDATGSIGAGSVGSPAEYEFRDSSSKARTVEFFYNPANINELGMASINLTTWTNVGLDNLRKLDISQNDFYELPKFGDSSRNGDSLAVTLEQIVLTGNNLSRAKDATGVSIPANTQLNTLPLTLTHLTMNGVFSDSTTIDLTDYTQLTNLNMSTYYARNAQRRMTGGTVTPKTYHNGTLGIVNYSIYNQPYSQLANGVCSSPRLNYLYFPWCGVTAKEGGGNITIASPVITQFISYGNSHNVVNMSSKNNLNNYIQAYSSPGSDKSLQNKFTGCSALTQIYCYGSGGITGDIGTVVKDQGLTSLSTLDVRYTGVTGELRDDSFSQASALVHFRVSGGNVGSGVAAADRDFWGTTDSITNNASNGDVFKDCSNLNWIYCYQAGNVGGPLPDFSRNPNLRGIYIYNTAINGTLPNLVNNQSLYYLRLNSSQLSGTIPTWATNALSYVFINNNNLSGTIPALQTPYLYYLYAQSNNLSGNLPTFAGAVRLRRLYLNSNSITGYTSEALKYNTSLSIIDLSNNSLPSSAGIPLIDDLFDNYGLNPRSGVSVNLLGNNGLNRSDIVSQNEGEQSPASKLAFLEQYWTILLDAT